MVCDLEAARITSLPADAFYIPDFVSEDEESWLLRKVCMVLCFMKIYGCPAGAH